MKWFYRAICLMWLTVAGTCIYLIVQHWDWELVGFLVFATGFPIGEAVRAGLESTNH